MAETIIKNTGLFDALYDGEESTFSTNEVSTRIVSGITASKEADKEIWINGPLEYKITVTNTSGVELENLVLTDILDVAAVAFDTSFNVRINDVEITTYDIVGDELIVEVGDLGGSETVVITFRVVQV